MNLRPGDQLASTVCGTRVVVVRAPATGDPVIACGGSPMAPAGPARPAPAADGSQALIGCHSGKLHGTAGTLIGKRYVDAGETLELLCTASGAGELSCDGVPMTRKAAKALPASD